MKLRRGGSSREDGLNFLEPLINALIAGIKLVFCLLLIWIFLKYLFRLFNFFTSEHLRNFVSHSRILGYSYSYNLKPVFLRSSLSSEYCRLFSLHTCRCLISRSKTAWRRVGQRGGACSGIIR